MADEEKQEQEKETIKERIEFKDLSSKVVKVEDAGEGCKVINMLSTCKYNDGTISAVIERIFISNAGTIKLDPIYLWPGLTDVTALDLDENGIDITGYKSDDYEDDLIQRIRDKVIQRLEELDEEDDDEDEEYGEELDDGDEDDEEAAEPEHKSIPFDPPAEDFAKVRDNGELAGIVTRYPPELKTREINPTDESDGKEHGVYLPDDAVNKIKLSESLGEKLKTKLSQLVKPDAEQFTKISFEGKTKINVDDII